MQFIYEGERMRLIDWHNIDFGHCKRYVLINGTPYVDLNEIAEKLKNIPLADAEPVKHGKWMIDEFGRSCSACEEYIDDDARLSEYCPHCGAKMDLE